MLVERVQKTVFYGELEEGKRSKVARRNATKIPLEPHCRISIFQLTPGSRLHRVEQSGVASSKMEQLSIKQSESV